MAHALSANSARPHGPLCICPPIRDLTVTFPIPTFVGVATMVEVGKDEIRRLCVHLRLRSYSETLLDESTQSTLRLSVLVEESP